VKGKAERLGRLLAIRRVAEEMAQGRLQLASAAVTEVETALSVQQTTLIEAGVAGREALAGGERGDWLMAEAQAEVAGWNRGRLGVLLGVRKTLAAPAMEDFLESRREFEQVKLLLEDARQAARIDQNRRAQAAADDWFLSRRVRGRSGRIVNGG